MPKAHTPTKGHPWKSKAPNGRLAKRRRNANRPYMRLTPEARAIVDDQVATLVALARSRRLASELKAEVDHV